MENFIPTTGHPNGDAVPVASTSIKAGQSSPCRHRNLGLQVSVHSGCPAEVRAEAIGFTPCLWHSAAETVQAVRREVDGAAGGVVYRQHEQGKN